MTEQQPFKKVLWRNGDVISNEHFFALEEWIEQLVGNVSIHNGVCGLFRDAVRQLSYNNLNNISFQHIEGNRYRINIEKIQGIIASGRIIKIDYKRSFDFLFRPIQRSPEEKYYLYIIPSIIINEIDKTNGSEISTGLATYDPMYEFSITSEENLGLLFCRFKVEDTTKLVIDRSFTPYGFCIDSSPMSLATRETLLQKFLLWDSLIESYLKEKLIPNANYNLAMPIYNLLWTMTNQLLRSNAMMKPILENKHEPTVSFFKSIQQFINSVRTEILAFSIGWEQEAEKHKAAEVLEILQSQVEITHEQQTDISSTFARAGEMLDALIKFLACLPGGPVAEKTLPISRVELIKETAGNRLNIYLDGEIQLAKGKTQMTISLREFSKADSLVKNIRVGMGSAIYAQLLDLKNLLKRLPGKMFSYTIECPPEIITKDRVSQLTLYLPPPLGEDIIDLKSHITIIIRD